MLEVKHITKIYAGKGGVSVKALDDVSVVFPEKGMVFLLGKSGSGKSTLLNLAGGLDKPDSGEIIVKGKSSREFSGSDFDSYRNTFIGFVFQEYNILNEFTIEQNIALALQLQSKPNDKDAVAALLEQVDLAGYGKRKPNTLSGGQKQRVAIARALIKEPEIIMADEPTGALDSNTGKQVFDTLKKLSETKLVIVVSHDREFAEIYGDRIIELKDGKIISDVSKVYDSPTVLDTEDVVKGIGAGEIASTNVMKVSDTTISIKDGSELTDEEVRRIGKMLRGQKGEIIITADSRDLPNVKRVCKINENGDKESFRDTEKVEVKEYDGSKTKFIKSSLPLGHAIKMGASGLKTKPIRLIFTILIAVAAFIMFGVASTFMLYDPNYSVSEAMKAENNPAMTLSKSYEVEVLNYTLDKDGKKSDEYTYTNKIKTRFGASEVADKSKSGLKFAGIFDFTNDGYGSGMQEITLRLMQESGYGSYDVNLSDENKSYYLIDNATGFSDCGEAYLKEQGFRLLYGTYPKDATEVAISRYLAELFVKTENNGITEAKDLLGKKITTGVNALNGDSFTVAGICDVGTIDPKFESLKPNHSVINDKEKESLKKNFADYLTNSFHLIIFVSPEFYDTYKAGISNNSGIYFYPQAETYQEFFYQDYAFGGSSDLSTYSFFTDETLRVYGSNNFRFYNLQGEEITRTANDVFFLSEEDYNNRKMQRTQNLYYRIAGLTRYSVAMSEEVEKDSYGGKYSGSSDAISRAQLAFIKKWQQTIVYRYYLSRVAQALYDTGKEEYMSGSYYTLFDKVRNYVMNNLDGDLPTDAEWSALETKVKAGIAAGDLTEAKKYYCILTTLREACDYYDKVFSNDWDVLDDLSSYDLSASKLATYKNTIDVFMTEYGIASPDSSTPFVFSDKAYQGSFNTLYGYLDRNYQSGTFTVAGYYKIVGSSNGNYTPFFSSAFLKEHAKYLPNEWGYNVNTYESSYVAPSDEKYNFLISPTDNSREQIAAALSAPDAVAFSVESNVYSELQMFLELIQELEKIFLYVGLGLGLLAAFFLLNFISVSISAKKKDIGILRAVGARGSDVFKIFYAESFIIAFICFVLATIGSYVLTFFLNRTIADTIKMSLLHFGVLNIGLIFGVAIFVSVIATFLPVFFAARKSPVEAIRAL